MAWPLTYPCSCGCGIAVSITQRSIRRTLRWAFGAELGDGIDEAVIVLMGNGRLTPHGLSLALIGSRQYRGLRPALVFGTWLDQYRAWLGLHPGQLPRDADVRYLIENAATLVAAGIEDVAEERCWWPPVAKGAG